MAKTGDNTSPEGQLHYNEENRHSYLITLDSSAGIYCDEIGLLGDRQVLNLEIVNICKRNQHFKKN